MLKSLTLSQAIGGWRTCVYLMGDKISYPSLAGIWSGIFGGEKSIADPVRTAQGDSDLRKMAWSWTMSDQPGVPGPGFFRHPYQYQSVLSSKQLAGYVHLPRLETPGFEINLIARFDVEAQTVTAERRIQLGKVVPSGRMSDDAEKLPGRFRDIEIDSLDRHAFITGTTGSGKTKTLLSLLRKLSAQNVPFLVIEPAKAEYRELLSHPEVGERLVVFTVGVENIAPFRINPFEVLPGTPVGVHIDLIKSVFSASFGLWTPLPQILEECLHRIYADRGWEIANNRNNRTENPAESDAFPTLADLVAKIDEVIPSYGFDPEAKGRVIGSLRSRLNGLRTGNKGRTFDVQQSIPMSAIMERPTLLEIQWLGDDDDKAFFMGLLLVRLFEYRQNREPSTGARPSAKLPPVPLKHVLIFEEAHRLLTNAPASSGEGAANPRAKAVESFCNLISEVRPTGKAWSLWTRCRQRSPRT